MINISAEDAKLFEQNGFTKEQVGATIQHYREQGLSDEDIQARMNARIGELRSNASPLHPSGTSPTGAEATKRGIDLTPSGLVKQGLATALAPIRGAIHNEDYKTARQNALNAVENFKPAGGAGDFLVDMAAYSQLPVLRGATLPTKIGAFAGNAAIQGGGVGALESLKREGDLSGFGSGTGIAAGIQTALKSLPYVNRVASKAFQFLPRVAGKLGQVQPSTVEQLIKPNSKGLELVNDAADNLATDTTIRVQKDFKNLMDNAGLDVQRAALNLPDERGVFASSLRNSLDDIYNGYSTSGQRELNPAFNNAGDIYDDINGLIEAGTTGGKVSAKNLNDIMGNIKNYPLDWSKTSANDKQAILKQIYGDFQRRLGNLSPELRKANREFSKIARFANKEGVRRIISPNVIKGENIDTAARALKGYHSSGTNTGRNLEQLENLLVRNGKKPFLEDINDVIAAKDLNKATTTGLGSLADIAKGALTRPTLRVARGINRIIANNSLPNVNLEAVQRLLNPLAVRLMSPTLYGGISNTEDY